jgi:membrane protease YdiL (CAAX protease family)
MDGPLPDLPAVDPHAPASEQAVSGSPAPDSAAPVSMAAGAAPTPARPPRVWPVFVALGAAVVVLSFGAGIILAVKLATSPAPRSAPDLDLGTLEGIIAVTEVVFIAAALIAARPFTPARLGLGRGRTTVGAAIAGVVGVVALSHLLYGVITLFGLGKYGNTMPWIGSRAAEAQGSRLVQMVLVVALLAGFAEELFFRGFMQRRLAARWPPWVAIAVTALCFAAVHADAAQSPLAFGLGLWLGYISYRNDSIWPAVLGHICNNAAATLGTRAHLPIGLPASLAVALIAFAAAAAYVIKSPVGSRRCQVARAA